MFAKLICIIAATVAIIALALFGAKGCGEFFPQEATAETDEQNFKLGQTLSAEKRDSEAMEAFYKVINARADAPESHLELGIISMRRAMPLEAIYHFRQYLRESPDSPQARQVNDQINAARKMFLAQLPGQPFENENALSGQNMEKKLRDALAENDALKREISILRGRVAEAENSRAGAPIRPVPGQPVAVEPRNDQTPVRVPPSTDAGTQVIPAFHVVVSGDTLSTISKKYYGTANRWREIYNYNRNIMRSPSELKLGMKLRLPPAE